PRRSVLRPTAPPTIVRSAAGLTLDFSEAIAGVSAAGAFLSADHAEPGGKRPARVNPAHERNRAPIFRLRLASPPPFAADVLVGPVVALEGPILLAVFQVARGLE